MWLKKRVIISSYLLSLSMSRSLFRKLNFFWGETANFFRFLTDVVSSMFWIDEPSIEVSYQADDCKLLACEGKFKLLPPSAWRFSRDVVTGIISFSLFRLLRRLRFLWSSVASITLILEDLFILMLAFRSSVWRKVGLRSTGVEGTASLRTRLMSG